MAEQQPIRILLIEDDDISIFLFKRVVFLRWPDIHIDVCRSGRSAMKALADPRTTLPNVIVADLEMPIMGGFEFISEFKKSPVYFSHNIQLVIATSSLQQEDRELARALNVSHYLVKPLTVESLEPIIAIAQQPNAAH